MNSYPYTQADETAELDQLSNEYGIAQAQLDDLMAELNRLNNFYPDWEKMIALLKAIRATLKLLISLEKQIKELR